LKINEKKRAGKILTVLPKLYDHATALSNTLATGDGRAGHRRGRAGPRAGIVCSDRR
jgi:hypothetical protein